MATKHPYVPSVGGLAKAIMHLRKYRFPPAVDSAALKKLAIAPNNESYVLNVLRFLDIIDDDGKGTDAAKAIFVLHDDAEFQRQFGELVQSSYAGLFELRGDAAWKTTRDDLIHYFRSNDGTTEIVGTRQARTFLLLCELAGQTVNTTTGTGAASRQGAKHPAKNNSRVPKRTATNVAEIKSPSGPAKPDFGLTVRVEINLPADGSQETYNRIFKSIRENFLDG